MSIEGQKFYPGGEAAPKKLLLLAAEYRRAAETLSLTGRRKVPMSRWPYRLVAIHAVELYLTAYLASKGHAGVSLRGMQHNLATRAKLAVDCGLNLRKRTAAHLRELTDTREYLVVRYGPESPEKLSQLNRLNATLSDVAKKVEAVVSCDNRKP